MMQAVEVKAIPANSSTATKRRIDLFLLQGEQSTAQSRQKTGRGFPVCAGSRILPLMCGRYASFLPPDLIARLFGTQNPLPNLKPTWNMAPTMTGPVVRRIPKPANVISTR